MQSSCARAAPAHPSRQSRQSHGNMRAASATTEKPPPKWHNPCGTQPSSVAQMSTDFFPEIPSTSDRELLEMVRLSAIGALAYAEDYKNDYVKQSFSVDFAEHHGDWSYMTSSWLPTIPKGLGKRLAQEHLDTETNLNSALARLYRDLQYYAVGLEQVTIDQEREKLGFAEMFRTVESRLRGLLCEIQTVMLDRNATFFDNVQPEVMPDDDRKAADRTQLNLRQWVIFRDYMNALEFTIELMDHYMKNLSSEALNMQSDNTIPSSES